MRPLLLFALTLAHLAPLQANAQEVTAEEDQEARMLFEAGRRAFSDGRFEEALGHYVRAHELSGRALLLFNVASAHDRLGDLESAAEHYRQYLEAVPDADNLRFVESRLSVLESLLAEQAAPERPAVEQPERTPEARNLVGPIALLGIAAAAAISALGTGLRANAIYGDLQDDCAGGVCSASRRDVADKMDRLALTTDIMLGAAAGLAIAGTLWWILGGDDDDAVQPSAACTSNGCSASALLRF